MENSPHLKTLPPLSPEYLLLGWPEFGLVPQQAIGGLTDFDASVDGPLFADPENHPSAFWPPPSEIFMPLDDPAISENTFESNDGWTQSPQLEVHSQPHTHENSATVTSTSHPWECDLPGCSAKFANWDQLSMHEWEGHPELKNCYECQQSFSDKHELSRHGNITDHVIVRCIYEDCASTFIRLNDYLRHYKLHLSGIPNRLELNRCNECQQSFRNEHELSTHGKKTGHNCFRCTYEDCLSTFIRLNDYLRHYNSHKDDVPRHPCTKCKKHREFKRKDHLYQHLRNYHHITTVSYLFRGYSCPHELCDAWRCENRETRPRMAYYHQSKNYPFAKRSELTEHLRKEHDETPFPCKYPGCDRVNGKGYVRKADLRRHVQKKHEDIPMEEFRAWQWAE